MKKYFVFFMCFHGYLHFSLSFYKKNSRAVDYQKWNLNGTNGLQDN
jgi:hypothetical protein